MKSALTYAEAVAKIVLLNIERCRDEAQLESAKNLVSNYSKKFGSDLAKELWTTADEKLKLLRKEALQAAEARIAQQQELIQEKKRGINWDFFNALRNRRSNRDYLACHLSNQTA